MPYKIRFEMTKYEKHGSASTSNSEAISISKEVKGFLK